MMTLSHEKMIKVWYTLLMNLNKFREIVEDRRDWQCVHFLFLVHKPSQFGEELICALGF